MKKILALTLALLMLTMCFVACNKDGGADDTTTPADNIPAETTPADNTPAETTPAETTTAAPELAYNSALELIQLIWNTVPEDQRFFVGGGNINNPDTASFDSAAKFVALADADYDSNLGYPEADVAKIDDAASMFHGMNVNNFTCAAYHFANSADVDAMVDAIKNNILARQWMCGFPEKLVIIKLPGDYLISLWGLGDGAVNTFTTAATTAVPGAEIVVDQPIAQ